MNRNIDNDKCKLESLSGSNQDTDAMHIALNNSQNSAIISHHMIIWAIIQIVVVTGR